MRVDRYATSTPTQAVDDLEDRRLKDPTLMYRLFSWFDYVVIVVTNSSAVMTYRWSKIYEGDKVIGTKRFYPDVLSKEEIKIKLDELIAKDGNNITAKTHMVLDRTPEELYQMAGREISDEHDIKGVHLKIRKKG